MAPFVVFRSEWQFVVWDDELAGGWIGRWGLVLFSCRVLEVGPVYGENDVAHFIDELEEGERLFGRPICRNADSDRSGQVFRSISGHRSDQCPASHFDLMAATLRAFPGRSDSLIA